MVPGEVIAAAGEIELNAGRKTIWIEVVNTGDRPVQQMCSNRFTKMMVTR